MDLNISLSLLLFYFGNQINLSFIRGQCINRAMGDQSFVSLKVCFIMVEVSK